MKTYQIYWSTGTRKGAMIWTARNEASACNAVSKIAAGMAGVKRDQVAIVSITRI